MVEPSQWQCHRFSVRTVPLLIVRGEREGEREREGREREREKTKR